MADLLSAITWLKTDVFGQAGILHTFLKRPACARLREIDGSQASFRKTSQYSSNLQIIINGIIKT